MTIHELKDQKQEKVNILIKQCRVFFAFSNEQFEEGKTPLEEGEKYVSMGRGGYLPSKQVKVFISGMDEISKWYKDEVKKQKNLRRDNIIYELGNHECWYTHDIEDAMRALGPEYTRKEVWKVFHQEREKQIA